MLTSNTSSTTNDGQLYLCCARIYLKMSALFTLNITSSLCLCTKTLGTVGLLFSCRPRLLEITSFYKFIRVKFNSHFVYVRFEYTNFVIFLNNIFECIEIVFQFVTLGSFVLRIVREIKFFAII